MLEQHARVIQSSEQEVWVEAVEPEGCGICAGQACSSRRITELFQRAPRHYKIESNLSLSAGDRVIVGVPEGSVLRSALYLYGLPLVLILASALLAQVWATSDVAAVLGALVGALAAGALIALVPADRRLQCRPVVVRRVETMVIANK